MANIAYIGVYRVYRLSRTLLDYDRYDCRAICFTCFTNAKQCSKTLFTVCICLRKNLFFLFSLLSAIFAILHCHQNPHILIIPLYIRYINRINQCLSILFTVFTRDTALLLQLSVVGMLVTTSLFCKMGWAQSAFQSF